ncbi:GntR family transcriptional regulator [Halosquirtibacter xylanolyticus]|uniref:GntR family transcriptional regulator n=1 Tax=Halosquirtibacter xylanolyticus TaxID=3374599 RepID=UPI00374A1B9D|nr:GntR family transcriptional regulator [Prolixibacteraceae bacterium]
MSDFNFTLDPNSTILRYKQLVHAVASAIQSGELKAGDALPSVNSIIKSSSLSRDTVFKAYAELKDRGVIESIPNKGYFVAKEQKRVFLFLDTFKAYKEVLYGAIIKSLPSDYIVDVHFHHYNIDTFETIISNAAGQYSKYVIMNFDHPSVRTITSQLDSNKLTFIDWDTQTGHTSNVLNQDFGVSASQCMQEIKHLFAKYKAIHCIYPSYTYHPYETVNHIKLFCNQHGLHFEETNDMHQFKLEANTAYIVFEDIDLATLLSIAKEKKFVLGEDVGVVSYNETPMKQFIGNGITVISTDFEKMGTVAASYIVNDVKGRTTIPTTVHIRESL